MTRGDRYVALGLAHARSGWFGEVARWSTSAALPLEFLKCVTVEEVRARLRTARPFSALLVDGGVAGFDRDLADQARSRACAVIVVDDGRAQRDWLALGATAVLPSDFGRDDLLDALAAHAIRISVVDVTDERSEAIPADSTGGWRGHLVAVTGPGGTGASTVAMAAAQGIGADARLGGLVALADLALDADMAMLHDAGDVMPGIQELVEIHRNAHPTQTVVRSMMYVTERNYDLLLGLRRHRDWVTIRPRAFDAALDSLRRTYKAVVAEVDHDVEGERQCGSIDVEERNVMARSAMSSADIAVVVGAPGPRGIHRMVRLIASLIDHGVDASAVLPVVNRAPRGQRARAEITEALAALTEPFTLTSGPLPTPVFIQDRKRFEHVVHGAARLPNHIVSPVGGAVRMMLERSPLPTKRQAPELVAVVPGSLGHWYDEDDA